MVTWPYWLFRNVVTHNKFVKRETIICTMFFTNIPACHIKKSRALFGHAIFRYSKHAILSLVFTITLLSMSSCRTIWCCSGSVGNFSIIKIQFASISWELSCKAELASLIFRGGKNNAYHYVYNDF